MTPNSLFWSLHTDFHHLRPSALAQERQAPSCRPWSSDPPIVEADLPHQLHSLSKVSRSDISHTTDRKGTGISIAVVDPDPLQEVGDVGGRDLLSEDVV